MARPQKTGLDYFPVDVDMLSDKKIKIVLARYHSDGYLFYMYLLSQIYREGYYIKIDDDFQYLASSDLNMSDEKIGQMLHFFVIRSLFDDKLYNADKVLTSTGIQRRYQEAIRSRASKKSVKVDARYWLLSKEETAPFIEVCQFEDKSEKNRGFSENNADKSENYSTNKSKENKSKVNEIIDSVDKPPRTRFIPPTLEEVVAYCKERNNNINPQRFVDYYTANGWVQGKSRKPIRDWKATVRTWERIENEKSNRNDTGTVPASSKPKYGDVL